MSDTHAADDSTPSLMGQALLYAAGELDGAEAEAFEQRLANEQAAREALARAVELTQSFDGTRPARPHPSYRARVVARLAPCRPLWARVLGPRTSYGHPVFWAGFGAAAAALLLTLLPASRPRVLVEAPPSAEPLPAPQIEEPEPIGVAELAAVWTTTETKDHLLKARLEEARRKARVQDLPRTLTGEDRPRRPVGIMH